MELSCRSWNGRSLALIPGLDMYNFFHQRYSYSALSPRQRLLWRLVRRFVPPQRRFFFEGHIQVPGQLWYADRELIYQTSRVHRPQIVFEVGTWQGGGSTLFIAQALCDNGSGKLYTVELDPIQHARAVESYRRFLPHLLPFVSFYQGSSSEVYPPVLKQVGRVDAVFLDGFGAEQSLAEFRLFEPYLREGAILMAHDWFDEKMRLLRPTLEADPTWEIQRVLTPPDSVGFALMRKRGE